MQEIWKDVPGYEGIYRVSNIGRVKSLRMYAGHYYKYREKILKPKISRHGYEKVTLRKNGNSRDFFIHRLVGECFLDKPNGKCEINHKDTNRKNNVFTNLEWVTHKENQNNPLSVIKQIGKNNHRYRKDNYSKTHSYQIICLETKIYYRSIREASRKTGIPFASIQQHLKGRLEHAGGYHWNIVEIGEAFI